MTHLTQLKEQARKKITYHLVIEDAPPLTPDIIDDLIETTHQATIAEVVRIAEDLEAPMKTDYDLESFHEGFFQAVTALIKALNHSK
jgi:hypothetical protein